MIIKPPTTYKGIHLPAIFLAGSIEMGAAENWQEKAEKYLDSPNRLILNPRRTNWDSSWEQSITNPVFTEQVEWELDGIKRANLILFYFHPDTKCPITLAELGLCCGARHDWFNDAIVCCPKGFWRKGNVDILCWKYDIRQVDNFDKMLEEANKWFKS